MGTWASFSTACSAGWTVIWRACTSTTAGCARSLCGGCGSRALTAARERLRLEATAREYQAKVADLRQKYDLRVTVELSQTLELLSPVQRIELLVKRRKGERRVALDWNPLARRLDPPPCEWSYAADTARVVCDDALHLVSPAGHAPCAHCGKSYCRACRPLRCPKCGQAG